MSNDEKYQVLYLKDGKEVLTEPESNLEATKRAKRMVEDGYQVGSVMDVLSAAAYMHAKYGEAEVDGQSPFFPIEQYKKASRDVDAEVDDSLVTAIAAEEPSRERVQTRHLAVELALEMYGNTADSRTAEELVADAQTILDFLEG
jgi:hypothetical protein